MATITKTSARFHDAAGVRMRRIGVYTGPASYATGGDSFLPGDVSLGTVEFLSFEMATNGSVFYHVFYDVTNETAIWIVGTTGLEVGNAVDLAAFTCRFEAVGK